MMGEGIVIALLVLLGGGCVGGGLFALVGYALLASARRRDPNRFDSMYLWLGGALSWVILGSMGWNIAFHSGETRLEVGAIALALVTGGFGPGVLLVGVGASIAARGRPSPPP